MNTKLPDRELFLGFSKSLSELSNRELLQLEQELKQLRDTKLTLSYFLKQVYRAPLVISVIATAIEYASKKLLDIPGPYLKPAIRTFGISAGSVTLYKVFNFLKNKAKVDALLDMIDREKKSRGIK